MTRTLFHFNVDLVSDEFKSYLKDKYNTIPRSSSSTLVALSLSTLNAPQQSNIKAFNTSFRVMENKTKTVTLENRHKWYIDNQLSYLKTMGLADNEVLIYHLAQIYYKLYNIQKSRKYEYMRYYAVEYHKIYFASTILCSTLFTNNMGDVREKLIEIANNLIYYYDSQLDKDSNIINCYAFIIDFLTNIGNPKKILKLETSSPQQKKQKLTSHMSRSRVATLLDTQLQHVAVSPTHRLMYCTAITYILQNGKTVLKMTDSKKASLFKND